MASVASDESDVVRDEKAWRRFLGCAWHATVQAAIADLPVASVEDWNKVVQVALPVMEKLAGGSVPEQAYTFVTHVLHWLPFIHYAHYAIRSWKLDRVTGRMLRLSSDTLGKALGSLDGLVNDDSLSPDAVKSVTQHYKWRGLWMPKVRAFYMHPRFQTVCESKDAKAAANATRKKSRPPPRPSFEEWQDDLRIMEDVLREQDVAVGEPWTVSHPGRSSSSGGAKRSASTAASEHASASKAKKRKHAEEPEEEEDEGEDEDDDDGASMTSEDDYDDTTAEAATGLLAAPSNGKSPARRGSVTAAAATAASAKKVTQEEPFNTPPIAPDIMKLQAEVTLDLYTVPLVNRVIAVMNPRLDAWEKECVADNEYMHTLSERFIAHEASSRVFHDQVGKCTVELADVKQALGAELAAIKQAHAADVAVMKEAHAAELAAMKAAHAAELAAMKAAHAALCADVEALKLAAAHAPAPAPGAPAPAPDAPWQAELEERLAAVQAQVVTLSQQSDVVPKFMSNLQEFIQNTPVASQPTIALSSPAAIGRPMLTAPSQEKSAGAPITTEVAPHGGGSSQNKPSHDIMAAWAPNPQAYHRIAAVVPNRIP